MNIVAASTPIVKSYVTLVQVGKKTIDEVPANLREEVAEILGISLTEITLEEAIAEKVEELSAACEAGIVAGLDINDEHYSYTRDDQENIQTAISMSKETNLEVPYHADGGSCRLYTLEEMFTIYSTLEYNKTHHQTYFNQLKLYTQTLTTIEEVNAITYGVELTGEYLATYQTIMAQAQAISSAYATA